VRKAKTPPAALTPQLLGALIDAHAAPLELFARQWCDSPEDVVQEAFMKLATRRKPPDRPVSWLYRVVRNGALTAARAARRRSRREAAAAASRPAWFVPSNEDRIDAAAAAHALRELPVEQRAVIVAHLWGGLTFGDAGEAVGCSSSSAHRRYVAGLQALRQKMGVTCP
jgi:RNA polymerase sigma factor (sigma-70 family)